MFKELQHLKPKIVWTGKRYLIISNKYGNNRVCGKATTFSSAVNKAASIFHTRIIGRAIRYERLRKMGVKEAQ